MTTGVHSVARQPLPVLKAELFKALGHPVRVRVLELLAIADTPVSEMLADTGVEPSTLSTHLAVLRRAGVVTGRRDGSSVMYALADPAVAGFLAAARTFLIGSLARGSGLLAELESEAATQSSAYGPGPDRQRNAGPSVPAAAARSGAPMPS